MKMKKNFVVLLISIAMVFASSSVFASEEEIKKELDLLKKELAQMSSYYEKKIANLESRLTSEKKEPIKMNSSVQDKKDLTHHHDENKHHHGLLDIGKVKIIGALDARYHNVQKEKNLLFLHEAKIGAQIEFTDWLSGYITLTKHHEEQLEIEEGYGIFKLKPWDLSFKPGKFFVDFGVENICHFFERKTITLSAMHNGLFGENNWADTGLQTSVKLPLPFYSQLSFSVINGDNAVSFGDGTSTISNNNFPIALHWTNIFNYDQYKFTLGNSFAYGKWDQDGDHDVVIVGNDLSIDWRNFYTQAELIYRYKDPDTNASEKNAYGYYVLCGCNYPLHYRYLESIDLLFRFGQFMPDSGTRETRYTPQIAFIFNDFAKLRFAYEIREEDQDQKNNRFITQFAMAF